MRSIYSPRLRAERVIAAGRLLLAAGSLFAIWWEPSEPAKHAATAYSLLVGYLGYSLAVALLVSRAVGSWVRPGLVTHLVDLVFFSVFMYFTSGPASPFFAYFVFALICATLRWQWRGALWTAAACLGAFAGFGYYFAQVLEDPSFESTQFIMRGLYMAVVAGLLAYLGRYEQRTRQEMSALAAWPALSPEAGEPHYRPLLEHVAKTLEAPRLALWWSRTDAVRPALLQLAGETYAHVPAPAGLGEGLTAPELDGESFLVPAVPRGGAAPVLVHRGESLVPWPGTPLSAAVAELLGPGPVLSVPWRGQLASGRLFVAGKRYADVDDLLLAEVVVELLGARVEAALLLERTREAAAAEERVRLARDLHDGVLQSFTGIGLRVAAVRRQLGEENGEVHERLADLQRLLAAEQRDLRFVIQDLEPPAQAGSDSSLESRLAELVQRVENEWPLAVVLDAGRLDEELPDELAREAYFLVREAVLNAARHGQARRVELRLAQEADAGLLLSIRDDGCGFPIRGQFDLAALAALEAGPRSLRERVAARGGDLQLDSGPEGSTITIRLPSERAGRGAP
ncbi:MAG: sensor histidine kinase [Thermoanaerobaculia bacterium]|nr:sensor histidine kinase [Thermoanaerobaculia bacterium]